MKESNDDAVSYFNGIKKAQAQKSQAICNECMGLDKCRQGMPGMYETYSENNGIGQIVFAYCGEMAKAAHRLKIARMFQSSGIPAEFEGDTWDSYKETKENNIALEAARWVANNDCKGALFYGSVGSGKTKLAAIIANEKMKAGKTVIFSSAPDLLQDIRATFNSKDKSTDEVLRELKKAECLIIDDLGAERVTEWVSEILFTLINHRYNNKLQTIITSNYSPKQLVMRLSGVNGRGAVDSDIHGLRIMSRLSRMCHFIELNGIDYRLQKSGRKAWQAWL